MAYVFSHWWWNITPIGFPHSDISGSKPFPALRSFSQVYASFFAYRYQGIHQQPLTAWSHKLLYHSQFSTRISPDKSCRNNHKLQPLCSIAANFWALSTSPMFFNNIFTGDVPCLATAFVSFVLKRQFSSVNCLYSAVLPAKLPLLYWFALYFEIFYDSIRLSR